MPTAADSRRAFLRRAGLAVAAGASLPLLESAPRSVFASADDPDQLFREGRFAAAERGYRRLLREDPEDGHAYAQIGYTALLSNRFGDAEKHLSKAVALEPGGTSAQRLAECYVRQDRFARAIPLLQSTGSSRDKAYGGRVRNDGLLPLPDHDELRRPHPGSAAQDRGRPAHAAGRPAAAVAGRGPLPLHAGQFGRL
ncbi:tetratricopeptide repeat protein [Actinomadura madurae]